MFRYAVITALFTALLPTASSFAVTSKEKMETCKFGADDQKLQGAARKAFMAKCMSNRDDPRGSPALAAPATVPATAPAAAPPKQ